MSIVPIFASIDFERPKSYSESGLSALSHYFNLGGRCAIVVKDNKVRLEDSQVSWYVVAVKVASYVLLLPLTMALFVIYLGLRYRHEFSLFVPPTKIKKRILFPKQGREIPSGPLKRKSECTRTTKKSSLEKSKGHPLQARISLKKPKPLVDCFPLQSKLSRELKQKPNLVKVPKKMYKGVEGDLMPRRPSRQLANQAIYSRLWSNELRSPSPIDFRFPITAGIGLLEDGRPSLAGFPVTQLVASLEVGKEVHSIFNIKPIMSIVVACLGDCGYQINKALVHDPRITMEMLYSHKESMDCDDLFAFENTLKSFDPPLTYKSAVKTLDLSSANASRDFSKLYFGYKTISIDVLKNFPNITCLYLYRHKVPVQELPVNAFENFPLLSSIIFPFGVITDIKMESYLNICPNVTHARCCPEDIVRLEDGLEGLRKRFPQVTFELFAIK